MVSRPLIRLHETARFAHCVSSALSHSAALASLRNEEVDYAPAPFLGHLPQLVLMEHPLEAGASLSLFFSILMFFFLYPSFLYSLLFCYTRVLSDAREQLERRRVRPTSRPCTRVCSITSTKALSNSPRPPLRCFRRLAITTSYDLLALFIVTHSSHALSAHEVSPTEWIHVRANRDGTCQRRCPRGSQAVSHHSLGDDTYILVCDAVRCIEGVSHAYRREGWWAELASLLQFHMLCGLSFSHSFTYLMNFSIYL